MSLSDEFGIWPAFHDRMDICTSYGHDSSAAVPPVRSADQDMVCMLEDHIASLLPQSLALTIRVQQGRLTASSLVTVLLGVDILIALIRGPDLLSVAVAQTHSQHGSMQCKPVLALWLPGRAASATSG
jgi:hypothetical protein